MHSTIHGKLLFPTMSFSALQKFSRSKYQSVEVLALAFNFDHVLAAQNTHATPMLKPKILLYFLLYLTIMPHLTNSELFQVRKYILKLRNLPP
jgi:hypothetical protein